MRGVILAAGRGSRMGEPTFDGLPETGVDGASTDSWTRAGVERGPESEGCEDEAVTAD